MIHTSVRPAYPEQRSRGRTLKLILPWIPRLIILVVVTYFGILFLMGGLNRARAWFTAPVVLPGLGIVMLVFTCLYALVRRRVNKNILLTGCLCILFLPLAIMPRLGLAYPASITSTRPSATVRLPANVPLKVMWGGDTRDINYHVISFNERWAYDFVVSPYFNGSPRLDDYGCYGVPVVAPTAGTIVSALDGEPDEMPGTVVIKTIMQEGNHIDLRIDEIGTYLVIAHLKQGSFRVAVGDTVEEGQVIAQCGNSGQTSEPHIHIHHQREDPNLTPPGLAEGLPLYFRDQTGAMMPLGGNQIKNGNVIWTGATVQHTGK